MPTTQKQASIARSVYFRSKGVSYSAFLHASTGDLIQQYDDDGNFYPEITPTNPIRLTFTATSSRQVGAITPDSITYKVAGIELAFDATGKCTTTTNNAKDYFKRDGADLLVIGNIAKFLNKVSSMIEATAKKGLDDLYACCPVDISEYQGGRSAKVSIAPGDDKNFTLTSQDDSVILRAGVLLSSGWVYDSPNYRYVWEIADPNEPSGWRCIQVGWGSGFVIIDADKVNTYANIKCTVISKKFLSMGSLGGGPVTAPPALENAAGFSWNDVDKSFIVGSDCVGVLDASDPLDINYKVYINRTGTGSEVLADEEALDDTMPSGAYLLYEPTIVMRDGSPVVGTVTWLPGLIVDPAGVNTHNVPLVDDCKYKVMVSDINSSYGEHTLVMTGELS